MAEHHPGLVQNEKRGLTFETTLEPAEQVEQHRQGVLVAHAHQLIDFEQGEIGVRQLVLFGV